jgi:hypothetical protein
MTNEQQRKMLECAAKACGVTLEREISGKKPHRLIEHESGEGHISVPWNPITNPADTAEMCAKLGIAVLWWFADKEVTCFNGKIRCHQNWEDHDNSRLKAWMWAATMVAAKIGGME